MEAYRIGCVTIFDTCWCPASIWHSYDTCLKSSYKCICRVVSRVWNIYYICTTHVLEIHISVCVVTCPVSDTYMTSVWIVLENPFKYLCCIMSRVKHLYDTRRTHAGKLLQVFVSCPMSCLVLENSYKCMCRFMSFIWHLYEKCMTLVGKFIQVFVSCRVVSYVRHLYNTRTTHVEKFIQMSLMCHVPYLTPIWHPYDTWKIRTSVCVVSRDWHLYDTSTTHVIGKLIQISIPCRVMFLCESQCFIR